MKLYKRSNNNVIIRSRCGTTYGSPNFLLPRLKASNV